MQTRWLAVGGGVVVAALVWLTLPERTGEQSSAVQQAASPAGAANGQTQPPTVPSAVLSRVPAVLADDTASVPTALRVRVVGVDGGPAVAATVLCDAPWVERAAIDRALSSSLQLDSEAWMTQFGVSATTDAAGVASIALPVTPSPPPRRWIHLCARHGDAFGETWVPWGEAGAKEHAIKVAADVEFSIRVRDVRDQGVPQVVVVARWPDYDAMFDAIATRNHPLARTDASGAATARHVQLWREQVKTTSRVRVGVDVPGLDGIGVDVDLDRLPAEPVVVFLPALGSLRVEVEGSLASADMRLSVDLTPLPSPVSSADTQSFASANASVTADCASFPRVATGLRWRATLLPLGRILEVEGPRQDGEEVVARFTLPRRPALVGRVLHAGQPLAERAFSWLAEIDAHPTGGATKTSADGTFRIECGAHAVGGQLRGFRVMADANGDADADGPTSLVGALPAVSTLQAGDNALADLAVASAPALLTGRLVGSGDRDGVQLHVVAVTGERVVGVDGVRCVLGVDGRFVAHGRTLDSALHLAVWSPRHLPVPLAPFVAGQRGLEVPLAVGGTVHADFVVGEDIAYITLAPQVVPSDGRARHTLIAPEVGGCREGVDRALPTRRGPSHLSHDPVTFRYTWHGLPPGRYRVDMLAYGPSQPLAMTDDFAVEDGGTTQVALVDLRARVRHVRVRFVDLVADKSLVRGSRGHVFVSEGHGLAPRGVAIDGDTVFLAMVAPVDLVVEVHGYRRQTLRGVFEPVDVRLEPGLPVSIRVANPEVVSAGDQILLDLVPEAALGAGLMLMSPAAGCTVPATTTLRCAREGEAFVVRVSEPGEFRVQAYLRASTGRTIPCVAAPALLRVGEQGGAFTIRVER